MGLFFIGEATAFAAGEATTAATHAAQPSLFESLVPFLFIFVLMYFLMIRPQVKKAKEHTALLKNLKPGDEIVTSGGIIGRIRSIADLFVTIDVGSTNIKVLKEHVSQQVKAQTEKLSKEKE